MKTVIGLDFGSDSVRCLIVDAADGRTYGTAVAEYPRWKAGLYSDASACQYRQHPLDYLESMEKCVREAMEGVSGEVREGLAGMSFDMTASTLAFTDRSGMPLALTPGHEEDPDAMFALWKDHTGFEEADRINEVAHGWREDYTRFTGGSYSCEWSWAKILKMLRHAPHLRAEAFSWVDNCDWIPALLTGNTDPLRIARCRCVAGHKALWHAAWGGLPPWDFWKEVDPLLLQFQGHLYQETYTADTKVGSLTKEWAEKLGLPEGLAVGLGSVDGHVGAVGAGVRPGVLVKVIGTSTCDMTVASYEAVGDRAVRGICGQVDGSILPGYIGIEAGQSAFGDVYAWYQRLLGWAVEEGPARDGILSRLTAEAEKLPLTPDDPVALDWFNGRRSPDEDSRARAAIAGLTLGTSAPQLYKALVEGTAFGSRAINERLSAEHVPVERIVAVGGISKKSPFVMQTLSDVMGMPIEVLEGDQACALGAAMFASVVAGIHPDVFAAQKAMASPVAHRYEPSAARHRIYDVLYSRYKELGNR